VGQSELENEPSEIAGRIDGIWITGLLDRCGPSDPEYAAGHIGETATVCSVVASAKYEADAKSQPTLLDLGKPSPNAIFTAVIYGDKRAKFGTPETSHSAASASV